MKCFMVVLCVIDVLVILMMSNKLLVMSRWLFFMVLCNMVML